MGHRRKETPLIKICPRCGRKGHVYKDIDDGEVTYSIIWEGSPRGFHDGDHDEDWFLNERDLVNPNLGCGYDSVSVLVNTISSEASN